MLMNFGPNHDGRIMPVFKERLNQTGEGCGTVGEDCITPSLHHLMSLSPPHSHHDAITTAPHHCQHEAVTMTLHYNITMTM